MSVGFDHDRPLLAGAEPDAAPDTGAMAQRPAIVPSLQSLAAAQVPLPQSDDADLDEPAPQAAEQQAPEQQALEQPEPAAGAGVPAHQVVELPPVDPADLEDSQEADGPQPRPEGADPTYGPQEMIGPQERPVTVRTGRNRPGSTGAHTAGGGLIGGGVGALAGGALGGALGAVFGGPFGLLLGGLVGAGAGALLGSGIGALAGLGVGAFRNRTSARLAAASARDTSPKDLASFANDEDKAVRAAAAANKNLAASDLPTFLNDADPSVRLAAVKNPNINPGHIAAVLDDISQRPQQRGERDFIDAAVAHRLAPPGALASLANSTDDHLVLEIIAGHRATTPETLLTMSKREDVSSVPYVMNPMARRSDLPQEAMGNLLDKCELYATERGSWRSVLKSIRDNPGAGAQADRARAIIARLDSQDPDLPRRQEVQQQFGPGTDLPVPDRRSAFAKDIDSSPLHLNRDTDAATTEAQRLGFTNVDLSDFSPESANEVVATLSSLKARYPTVSGLEFLGSISTHAREDKKRGFRNRDVASNVLAYTRSGHDERQGVRGFAVADRVATDRTASEDRIRGSYQDGHGTGRNLAGVIAHEFGHALQNHLELTDSFGQLREHLMRMRAKGDTAVAREVSMYATDCGQSGDPTKELFAELFCDYIMSASPSPNAKLVGKMTDAAMNSQKHDEHFEDPLAARDAYERTVRSMYNS